MPGRRPAAEEAGELERVEEVLEWPEASESLRTEIGKRDVGDVGDCGMSAAALGRRLEVALLAVSRREGGGRDGGGGMPIGRFWCW